MLKALVRTAEGDGPHAIQAQQALVELSLAAERDERLADALARLDGDGEDGA